MADKITQYYQCKLRCGNSETVGWIEARGAKVGAVVEILPRKLLWTVIEVYPHGLPPDVLRDLQRKNRHSLASIDPIS